MNRKPRSRRAWLLPLLPVLLGSLLLVADTAPQQALRNALFDQYQRWRPRVYVEAPVRIVDIDEESLSRLGQWPWPRTRIAELLERIGASGASVVAFDVMFSEADRTSPRAAAELWQLHGALRDRLTELPDHDEVFARSLAAHPAVLGFALERGSTAREGTRTPLQKARFIQVGEAQPDWLHDFSGAVSSLPALEAATQGNGAMTFVPDGDGVVRRVPLVLGLTSTPVATFAAEALRVAQGASNITLKSAGKNAGLAEVRIGELAIPTTPQGEIWVHYTLPSTLPSTQQAPERYLPAWQVLAGKTPAEQLAGKIVLIGSSAQGLMDLRFSPFGLIPGVEAHAQALEQILSGHFLERPSWARGAEGVLLIAAGLLAGFLALRGRALWAAGYSLLLVAALFGGAWQAFVAHGLLLDAATPALGVLLTFIVCSLWHHFGSEREQRWIKAAFARYVSPNRVQHLADHPDDMQLGGTRQQCSFIFTDLANFTSLMERIDPGEAVALLNTYIDRMIAIAFRHEGTLDRIVGDSVAIMFSAPVPQPDHRRRALACALEMDAFANAYARDLQDKGIPFGRTRIGVHGGEVIVGNFGGANIFDYRALGDPVNTASRLEAVNKHLGTRICISEYILADATETVARPVGRLVLKGKDKAIRVFEPIIGDGSPRAPLADYTTAYQAMQTKDGQAITLFATLYAACPDDPLIALHHRRLQAGERGDLIVMSEK